MNQEVTQIIATRAREALDKVADNPNIPGLDASAVRTATQAVTKNVAPVVENLANREPWYKSRVIMGLLVALISKALEQFLGLSLDPSDQVEFTQFILDGVTYAGAGFALYGRVTTKPALGSPK